MTTSETTITPLRQRMLEDMGMRNLSDKTQTAYVRAVRRLTHFLGRSPDSATIEDLRRGSSYSWSTKAHRRSR